MIATTATPVKPGEELKAAVIAVAEEMNQEPWQKNLLAAMDFVLTGAVDLAGGAVRSGAHQYQFDDEHGCTCPDGALRNRWCKHVVAVEMQRRVDERMEGGDMPAKAKTTPQDEWEAKTQSGEASEEPELFDKSEPDDIPDPEVPPALIPQPTHIGEQRVNVQGHQYTDYPSTLCIKRHVGMTEVMWTFRGTQDEEVWGRVSRMIRVLDEAGKRYVPQPQPAPQQQSAPPAPPPVEQAPPPTQAAYVQTAAGQVPVCPVHQRTLKPSQYGGFYCTGKSQDGSYCKVKVQP